MNSISDTEKKYAFDHSDPNYRAIRAMLDNQFGRRIEELNLNIAADDDMYYFVENGLGSNRGRALSEYFLMGTKIIDVLSQVVEWYFGEWNNVPAYLDFACGHGRSTRFLTSLLPTERVWVAEILPSAVQFQAEEFGFHALQSKATPEDFDIDQKFGLIFACSLFTHLPESSFERWLAKLYSLLNPGGLLIFTVHDASIKPDELSLNERGFFGAASEIRGLDPYEYGFCFANESFVREAIQQATGRQDYGRLPRGLAAYQDIYFVASARNADVAKFEPDRGASGCVDRLVVDPSSRRISVSGWTASMTQGILVERIEAYFNDRLFAATKPTIDRPDVAKYLGDTDNPHYRMCGWELGATLPSDANPRSDFILIKAVTTSGKQIVLDCRLLDSFIRRQPGLPG